jgi:hypothetical protein
VEIDERALAVWGEWRRLSSAVGLGGRVSVRR